MILENRQLNKVPFFHHLAHNMHGTMAIFAATGAFLSFFHQGSLGGVAGVLYGRPFAVREGLLIWPWTFFLFTWSAAAFGPCFHAPGDPDHRSGYRQKTGQGQCDPSAGQDLRVDDCHLYDGQDHRYLFTGPTGHRTGAGFRISAISIPTTAFTATGYWWRRSSSAAWFPGCCSSTRSTRENPATAAGRHHPWRSSGYAFNRWVMVLQVVAVPVMPFDTWALYIPSWQEVATTILPVAYGIILIAFDLPVSAGISPRKWN
jgi:menaquinone reductase, integral membrane subunit